MDDGDAAAAVDESEWVEDAGQSYELDGVELQAAAVNTQHIG